MNSLQIGAKLGRHPAAFWVHGKYISVQIYCSRQEGVGSQTAMMVFLCTPSSHRLKWKWCHNESRKRSLRGISLQSHLSDKKNESEISKISLESHMQLSYKGNSFSLVSLNSNTISHSLTLRWTSLPRRTEGRTNHRDCLLTQLFQTVYVPSMLTAVLFTTGNIQTKPAVYTVTFSSVFLC